MIEPTRDLLSCAAALLDSGRTVDRLSRPLTAAALIGLLVYPAIVGPASWVLVGFAILVALAGLAEAYFASRVGFDRALFNQLATAPEAPDFTGIDAALTRLGLLPAAKIGRPAEARIAGAKRLLGFQILALVAQVLSVVAGACIALTWR
jgi:hypothetical protein